MWALFALLACLTFLLVAALAEQSRQREGEKRNPTSALLVPASALSDRSDWLQNGRLELDEGTDGAVSAPAWRLFEITAAGARLRRGQGESFVRMDCGGKTCIAGLWQRLDGLAAGQYYLEADVYLEGESAEPGAVAARLGFDANGAVDPTSPGVTWSTPARGRGWQRISLELEESGGSGTVFIVFDALSAGADCRLAGARLLGPAGIDPPTPGPDTIVPLPEPTITDVEVRALYVSLSAMDLEDDSALVDVLDRAASARFNTVYLQVRRLGLSYYDSGVDPPAEPLQGPDGLRWDPLARAVELAQERGLRLFAWVEVLPVWESSVPLDQQPPGHLYHLFTARFGGDWLQPVTEDGLLYASPAHPQVRAYLASVCSDLVTRYPVDGLHLTGLVYTAAPEGEAGQALALLLEQIRREVRAVRPEAGLSAEVWPVRSADALPATEAGAPVEEWERAPGEAGPDFGQDAVSWMRAGLLDLLMPGVYLEEALGQPEYTASLVADWEAAAGWTPVIPVVDGGLQPFATLEEAIARARRAGAGGVAVYDAARLTARGYWQRLAHGPFSRSAETPPLLRAPGSD